MFLVPLLLVASTLHAGPESAVTPPLPHASPSSQLITAAAAGNTTAPIVRQEESGAVGGRAAGAGGAARRATENRMVTLTTLLLVSTLLPGPERAVTPPVADAAPHSQWVGGVATNGNVALVVWNDGGALAGVRIGRDGEVLDARPLVISPEAPNWPTVVRGDGNWLVTWIGQANQLMQRFVGDDGTMSDAVAVVPAIAAEDFDAAFDGRTFLVAWNAGTHIEAVRLAPDGAVLGRPLPILARGRFSFLDVVALAGGGFAVGAIDGVQKEVDGYMVLDVAVEVFRLDADARLLSSASLERTTTRWLDMLRLTADGDTLVAAWIGALHTGGGEDLFIAREGGPPRIVATAIYPQAFVTSAGKIHLVAVDPTGGSTILIPEDGTERRTIAGKSYAADAASFGDRIVVATNDHAGGDADISITVIGATLEDVAPRRRLAFAPAVQQRPAVARNRAGEVLVAWVESGHEDGSVVMAARLDSRGRPLGEAFVVAPVTYTFQVQPHVASDGNGYLVAWYDGDGKGVRARRVSREGAVSATEAFVAHETVLGPELCAAWSGTEYLVGSVRILRQGRRQRDARVRVTPVSAEGVAGETRVVIEEVPGFQSLACAGGDAGVLMVAAGDPVFGVLVTPGGTTIGPASIGSTSPISGLADNLRTAVAANGRSFLVAWNTYGNTVEWAVVNDNVVPTHRGGGFPLENPAFSAKPMAVASYRNGYLLAWGALDVRALVLDATGGVAATGSISETPLVDTDPALAGGGSTVLAFYTREVPSDLHPQVRVFMRTVGESVPRRRVVRH